MVSERFRFREYLLKMLPFSYERLIAVGSGFLIPQGLTVTVKKNWVERLETVTSIVTIL